jgi:CBS domain-containing protein
MASERPSQMGKDSRSTDNSSTLEETEPQRIGDIMQCGVITVRREESVYKAIGIMAEKHVSGLPVVDDVGLAGIISEKDVLKLLYDSEFLPGNVEDYMTKDVVSFDIDGSVSDICECLTNNNFRRVTILHQGRLAGIVSRADLIRANKDRFKPKKSSFVKSAKHQNGPLAQDIMQWGLLTAGKNTPICQVVEVIATKNITGLPVVDDYMNLLGIVSEKDVLKLLYHPQPQDVNVEDIMTEKVVSFNQDDSLFDVCDCLIENNFRRVPVLNQGRLVGIVSRADIIVYILKNKSTIFKHRHLN